MIKLIFVCLMLGTLSILTSCSGHKSKSEKDSVLVADTGLLADHNFVIKKLTNTNQVWNDRSFDKGKMFTDSSHQNEYVKLTSLQVKSIIEPLLAKELHLEDKQYGDLQLEAFFIAKQDRVGAFCPIVVYIKTILYNSFTMIVLDKQNKPVDHFNLCGGEFLGPSFVGDSVSVVDEPGYSCLNKNEIISCKMKQTDFVDESLKKPSIVDSVVYKNVINSSGKIESKQIASSHYKIPFVPRVSY